MTALPTALVPWREGLEGLHEDLLELLAGWLPRLSVAMESVEALETAGRGEPDGYDGLSTRGPWERLVPTAWALADAVPDEFLRRAAEKELSFWRLGRRDPQRGWHGVIWLDVGPEMVGAPRLVGLAAGLVLARRIREAGGEPIVVWRGPGQDGLGDPFDLASLKPWLRTRTRRPPTLADLEALWADLLLDGERDRLWAIGGAEIAGVASAAGHAAVAVVESLETRALDVELVQRRPRSIRLPLPPDRTVSAILRDPLAAPPRPMAAQVAQTHVVWSPTGSRLFLVCDRVAVVLEASPLARGKPRQRTITAPDPIVAVAWKQQPVFLLRQGPILRFWFVDGTRGAWHGAPPGVPVPTGMVVRGMSRLHFLSDPRPGNIEMGLRTGHPLPAIPRAAALMRDAEGTLWLLDVLNGQCVPVLRNLVSETQVFRTKAPRIVFGQRGLERGDPHQLLEWVPHTIHNRRAREALRPFVGASFGAGPVVTLRDQAWRAVATLTTEPRHLVPGPIDMARPLGALDGQGVLSLLHGASGDRSWFASRADARADLEDADRVVLLLAGARCLLLDPSRRYLVESDGYVETVRTPLPAPWVSHAVQPRGELIVGLDERGHLVVVERRSLTVVGDYAVSLEPR